MGLFSAIKRAEYEAWYKQNSKIQDSLIAQFKRAVRDEEYEEKKKRNWDVGVTYDELMNMYDEVYRIFGSELELSSPDLKLELPEYNKSGELTKWGRDVFWHNRNFCRMVIMASRGKLPLDVVSMGKIPTRNTNGVYWNVNITDVEERAIVLCIQRLLRENGVPMGLTGITTRNGEYIWEPFCRYPLELNYYLVGETEEERKLRIEAWNNSECEFDGDRSITIRTFFTEYQPPDEVKEPDLTSKQVNKEAKRNGVMCLLISMFAACVVAFAAGIGSESWFATWLSLLGGIACIVLMRLIS